MATTSQMENYKKRAAANDKLEHSSTMMADNIFAFARFKSNMNATAVKIIAYLAAAILIFFGVLFIWGA